MRTHFCIRLLIWRNELHDRFRGGHENGLTSRRSIAVWDWKFIHRSKDLLNEKFAIRSEECK